MNFWKTDGLYINLDSVTHVTDTTDPRTRERGVKVHFVGMPERASEAPSLLLEGSEADRFLTHLENNSSGELKNSLIDLEQQLAHLDREGGANDLSAIRLQQAMQQHARVMQTTAETIRMMHKTLAGIISNMR